MATFGFFGGADPFRELRRLQAKWIGVMGALSGPGQWRLQVFSRPLMSMLARALRSWRNCPASTKTTSKSRRTTTPSPCAALAGHPPSGEKHTIGRRGGAAPSAAAFSFLTGSIPVASKRTSRTACCG